MLNVVLVGHGEERDVVPERNIRGDILSLHPENHRAFIDLTFNGSKPVRVYMDIERYEQAILSQYPSQESPYLNYVVR